MHHPIGELRQINKLRYWPLDCILHDKYVPFSKRRSRRDRLVPHPHAPPAPRQTCQGLRPCTPQLARRRLKSRGRLTLSAVRKKMRRGEYEGILFLYQTLDALPTVCSFFSLLGVCLSIVSPLTYLRCLT
jgi:hypothetical protein